MVRITLWPAMGILALVFRQRHWKRGYFFAGVCSDLCYAFFFYLVNAHNGVHRDIRTLYAFKFAAQSVFGAGRRDDPQARARAARRGAPL